MRSFQVFCLCLLCLPYLLIGCSKQNSPGAAVSGPKVTIYFTKANEELGVVLIPIYRKIPNGKTAYETALKELFLGPTLEEQEKLGLHTEIPVGSRLISVDESSKEVKIDVSSQFMYGGGSEAMQARFRQLRETALTLAKGRPVYLYIDGQKAKTIGGEGLEVPQPLGAKLD